jgi:hypothetical protein
MDRSTKTGKKFRKHVSKIAVIDALDSALESVYCNVVDDKTIIFRYPLHDPLRIHTFADLSCPWHKYALADQWTSRQHFPSISYLTFGPIISRKTSGILDPPRKYTRSPVCEDAGTTTHPLCILVNLLPSRKQLLISGTSPNSEAINPSKVIFFPRA